MNAKPSLLVLVAALVFALPAPAATEQSPLADSADVESIDAILKAVYEVISGDAGVKRDWDRFRSLFAPGATLSPTVRSLDGAYGRQIITPDEYAGNVGSWLEANGFHEVEIHRVTERYGAIAHAFSTYESRRQASDPEPFARGINSIQLLYDGKRGASCGRTFTAARARYRRPRRTRALGSAWPSRTVARTARPSLHGPCDARLAARGRVMGDRRGDPRLDHSRLLGRENVRLGLHYVNCGCHFSDDCGHLGPFRSPEWLSVARDGGRAEARWVARPLPR